jgi:ACS family glucarate transporter-like MFS transporter
VTVETNTVTAAPTRVRYVVLFWLCLASIIAYTQRNTLGAIEKDMRQDLGWTTGQSAKVMATGFFLTYALGQVPAGWFGHVWGSRRALALFSAVCSVASGLCGVAGHLEVFVGLRGTMGLNQAGLFPCTTGTVKAWFPWTRWGFANGFITASQQIGGAGGMMIAGAVAAHLGWRSTFFVFAVPGLIWAVWFYYWFRDRPEEHPAVNAAELALLGRPTDAEPSPPSEAVEEPIPWGALLLSPALFWICTQQVFRGAGYIFYSTWFPTYLRESFEVDGDTAAWLTSLPLWANAVGCVAGGGFSDWLLHRTGSRRISRQGMAVVSQLACAAMALVATQFTDVTVFVGIMTLGSLCAAAGGPLAYAITIDMGGRHVRPVFSLMNMWGNLGSLAFPQVVAWLVGPTPKPADWAPVLPLFAAIYAVAGLCWLGFNPDRPILPEPAPDSPLPDDDG